MQNSVLSRDITLEIISLILWIITIFTLIYGGAIIAKSIKSVYYPFISDSRAYNKKKYITSDNLPAVYAYGILLNRFLSAINFPVMGPIKREIIKFFEHNPILFENCIIRQDGTIDFEPALKNANRVYANDRTHDVCIIFSALGSKLLKLFGDITSREHAEAVLSESYEYMRESCGPSSVIFDILRSLPEGVLEEEKIILLPRSELETRVREQTRELEESKKYLNNIIDSMIDMLIVVGPVGR